LSFDIIYNSAVWVTTY